MKAQWGKGAGRILLGDNADGGNAVANHVPAGWSSDFDCTASYTSTNIDDEVYRRFH